MANLMLSVMGAFAECLSKARSANVSARESRWPSSAVPTGDRKKSLNSEQICRADGELRQATKNLVARDFGISRETLYQCKRVED